MSFTFNAGLKSRVIDGGLSGLLRYRCKVFVAHEVYLVFLINNIKSRSHNSVLTNFEAALLFRIEIRLSV